MSFQGIYVLQPQKIEHWHSDTIPLKLSLIVSLIGYKSGSARILILKSSVLGIPSWIQFKPFAVNLPLNDAALYPPLLFKGENKSMACS